MVATATYSQKKVQINLESKIVLSGKDNLLPHYQYTNQWGVVDPFEQKQALVLAGAKYKVLDAKRIRLDAGVSGVFKHQLDKSFLHEAYVKGEAWEYIGFFVGKYAFTPLSYNDELTIGGFFMNSNARPIPRATIGLFDYFPLHFLNDRIEIKGGISQGILNDNRTDQGKSNSVDRPLLHEKWAYMRLGKARWQPYMGLSHSAIFGGARINGKKIPIDFWPTFTAQGSEKIGGGEATNAAGAHEGFWDFGIYANTQWARLHFYVQKPFADGSGMKIYRGNNRDYKIGLLSNVTNGTWLRNLSIEVFKTDYQSGQGIPDPLYPSGSASQGIIWLDEIPDYDAFMQENFGVQQTGWNKQKVLKYLQDKLNQGNKYGGRDDYNNNGSYYNGWTYHQQSMGMPLYHTFWQAGAYAPEWKPNNSVVFMNNRIKGFHVGLHGAVSENITYLLKATYTYNKGAYPEQYIRRYSWEEDPDFFYKGGKKQTYTYLSLNYTHPKWNCFSLSGSVSFDGGALYNAWGGSLGIRYTPSVSFL
ncbi:Capsule assembly protein Wzi [Saccharicrinis carchari]|uniref:Capsule assembly protein Wzi n=2 Tax=Saccharicrinis carchari TaxID=1168039 RepID=A0A521BUH9_SACCC|nr:Capsule assembly protein Wzi [Saccharicrinis carchari]